MILTRWQWPDTETLRLVVRDDGIGIDVDKQHAGFGLLGMRERVLSLGGSLQISRPRGGGTRVRVILPNDGAAPRTGVDGPVRAR